MAPIQGQSTDPNTPAVSGENTGNGPGVRGDGFTGVWGEGGKSGGEGVHGVSHSINAGVGGYNDSTGAGVYGKSDHGDAGHFEGNVTITGDVVLTGADCAEE